MKKMITLYGLDALRVALATNRHVEVFQQVVGTTSKWTEAHSWEAKAVASREAGRVRLRGYANVLREAAKGPDHDAVVELIDEAESYDAEADPDE